MASTTASLRLGSQRWPTPTPTANDGNPTLLLTSANLKRDGIPDALQAQPPRPQAEAPVSLYRETLDCCFRTMQAELQALRHAVYDERESRNPKKWSIHAERDARKAVDAKIDHLAEYFQSCKKRFVSYHSLPQSDLRKAVTTVEERGNIQVDLCSDAGQVHFIRPLLFQRRTAGDPPTAEFANKGVATSICSDLAEVAKLFDCSVAVEGHTKGGEGEFWQALANNRARHVAEKLVSLGIDAEKISCQGRPGKNGVNNSCTIVRLGIPSMAHQPVQSWPQGVMVDAPLPNVEPPLVFESVRPSPPYDGRQNFVFSGVHSEGTPNFVFSGVHSEGMQDVLLQQASVSTVQQPIVVASSPRFASSSPIVTSPRPFSRSTSIPTGLRAV